METNVLVKQLGLIAKKKRLSHAKIAAKLNLKRAYVTRLFNGRINPNHELFLDLCDAVGVQTHSLRQIIKSKATS